MSVQPISLQSVLEGAPIEESPESGDYLVSVRSGVIHKIGYSSLTLSPSERAANGEVTQILGYLAESGDFDTPTLALIEEKRTAGWPDYAIHIRIMGTSVGGLGTFVGVSAAASVAEISGVGGLAGLGSLAGIFVSADAAEISGVGVAIGLGSLTGISGAISVAEISGAGIALGTGNLAGVQTASSMSDLGGIGIAAGEGIGSVTGVLATLSVAELLGAGISLGIGALAEVVVGTSVEEISGSGEVVILGTGELTDVSAGTSVAEISGTGVALGAADLTSVTVSTVVAEISGVGEVVSIPGIASLTGVTTSSSSGTVTGVGVVVGIGAATGVAVTSSVASVGGVGAASAPLAPSGFSVSNSPAQITAVWTDLTGETSYELFYSTNSGLNEATDGLSGYVSTVAYPATPQSAVSGHITGIPAGSVQHVLNGMLTQGTTYYVRVGGRNGTVLGTLAAASSAAAAAILYDAFTGEGALGSNWGANPYTGTATKTGGKLVSNGNAIQRWTGSFGSNQFSRITVDTLAISDSSAYGVTVRDNGSKTYYALRTYWESRESDGYWYDTYVFDIIKIVGGAYIGSLLNIEGGPDANITLKLEISGSLLTAYYSTNNGTNWTLIDSVTDSVSPIATGNPGFYVSATGAIPITLDNWYGGTL